MELALAITTTWSVYTGVDEDLLRTSLQEMDIEDIEDRIGNAIEIAIIGKAKHFIKSPACQKVINGIWRSVIQDLTVTFSLFLQWKMRLSG